MKITCSLLLLSLTLSTASAAPANGPRRPRQAPATQPDERPEPGPAPEVVGAARLRTTYLADALRLSLVQIRQVRRPIYEALRQLHVLAPEPLGGRPVAEVDIQTRYHHRLAHILTTSQYLCLLRLEAQPGGEEAPRLLAVGAR